jgi:hypothetical protein
MLETAAFIARAVRCRVRYRLDRNMTDADILVMVLPREPAVVPLEPSCEFDALVSRLLGMPPEAPPPRPNRSAPWVVGSNVWFAAYALVTAWRYGDTLPLSALYWASLPRMPARIGTIERRRAVGCVPVADAA